MTAIAIQRAQHEEDRAVTLRNRAKLDANVNLLYWYRSLYREQFGSYADTSSLRILEIGSGVSPLKRFYSNVLTSDVLRLDYVDYVFDCHKIDRFDPIPDGSLDVIALTNVLHHLENPIDFLKKAAKKLKPKGQIIATEPFLSVLSTLFFKYLHHEPVDLCVERPVLTEVRGPLTSANIALPWLIFMKKPAWQDQLRDRFDYQASGFRPFSCVSYMATGGISHRLPIPSVVYRFLFHVDLLLSRLWPQLFASFFTIRLIRK